MKQQWEFHLMVAYTQVHAIRSGPDDNINNNRMTLELFEGTNYFNWIIIDLNYFFSPVFYTEYSEINWS